MKKDTNGKLPEDVHRTSQSLLLTFFFCFCTVNLELLTGTYSLFGETLYL